MTPRNLSPQRMFEQLALAHQPACRFEQGTDFSNWKAETLPRVVGTLGDFPPRVPLDPQLMNEWQHDGLRKQRWLIDVGPYISAAFQINYPGDWQDGEKRPTILCWHGHGPFGKEPIMGNTSSPELRNWVERSRNDYGHRMAKAGFITYAIDWIGGGERGDGNKPHFQSQKAGTRDWCNLYYLHATMLGMTSLSINVVHGMAATDFACSLPGVDEHRLGIMGQSGGGTMALWSALCDERFKAIELICYSDLWEIFGFRDINYCGMQVAPGLYKLVDLPHLQGLLAPRPLLLDIGVHDTCFQVDGALECYREVERIYGAAEAGSDLELDLFVGEHSWGANKSVEFFGRYLK